jgi:poly-gamma-glutamate synthesis protein (capsule biosynthesis protein)
VADEIKWMGIDIVSLATNHSLDWMFGGLKETIDNLDRVGIPHAGTGMNLAEARAPGFFDSEQGRVALIDVDTSKPQAEAGDARRDAPGRPGNSPIKISQILALDAETFEAMRRIANTLRTLGFGVRRDDTKPLPVDTKEIDLGFERRSWPVKFVLGDKPSVSSIPDEKDVNEVMQIVSDARRQADWVFVSQHHHVTDGRNRDVPSKAVEEFAHTCLDKGVDAYIGTGAHRIQGIEIYEERPIIYCLPDFIQQRDMGKAPPQAFYKRYGLGFSNTPMDAMDARGMKVTSPPRGSGIVVCAFHKHRVVDIKIYPVDPQADLPRWQMGRPLRADEALGRKIVEHWAKLSEPYGTKIDYENGIGIVRLS